VDIVAPAPWTLTLEGLVWTHRAVPGAADAHQPGLSFDRALPLTVGGFARYHASPVGPYTEVWGSPGPVVRAGAALLAIPFMAVDSEASLRGGRANWALPKEPAAFDGWSAHGAGWSLRAQVVSRGPRVPLALAGGLLQARPDGAQLRSRASVQGTARLARIEVDGEPPAWLRLGRHVGLVIERARLTVGLASVV
jgi:hypothetical protein